MGGGGLHEGLKTLSENCVPDGEEDTLDVLGIDGAGDPSVENISTSKRLLVLALDKLKCALVVITTFVIDLMI
jgi:hypothetical protein